MEFDYVIVGAGSAGCVLANRLSEDPEVTVCLVEAGPRDTHPLIHIPLGMLGLFSNKSINWCFSTVAQTHAHNRRLYVPRGKVLGGSSSINGMVYSRGHSLDYDDWANAGNVGWSFEDVLPYFKRSENNEDFPNSAMHGTGGPLNVKFMDEYSPLTQVLFDAAGHRGYEVKDDLCLDSNEGFAKRQVTQLNGQRVSTATAFLAPATNRRNLTVLTKTLTNKVLLNARKATGVEITQEGKVSVLSARREVILSAGTIGSPHLLKLSGIGPGEELATNGIPVVHHLPGVGENYQDHICVPLRYQAKGGGTYGPSTATLPKLAASVLRYLTSRKGVLANVIFQSSGYVRLTPGADRPDLQFIFFPAPRSMDGKIRWGQGFELTPTVMRPQSRGHVRLASASPHVAPALDPRFFSAPEDLDLLVGGLKEARELINAPSFAPFRGVELQPGSDVQDDPGLANYVREHAHIAHHPVGTCKMGQAADAVVDAALLVRGCDNLRVVDASIMPTIVTGNTNAPTIMIAEKAADLIKSRDRARA